MDSTSDTDAGRNNPSTSYADIAFGRLSPSPFHEVSDMKDNEPSETLERELASPRERDNLSPVESHVPSIQNARPQLTTSCQKHGTTEHESGQRLKAPVPRRSRDQRSGASTSRNVNRKVPFLRHASASPCAPRKQTGHRIDSSPLQRSASAVPPDIQSNSVSTPTEAELPRSRSSLWNPDGKSLSYAEMFFGHPSTPSPIPIRTESFENVPTQLDFTCTQDSLRVEPGSSDSASDAPGDVTRRSVETVHPIWSENIEFGVAERCDGNGTESTIGLFDSAESDVFSAMSQFQCDEEVEGRGRKDQGLTFAASPAAPKAVSYSKMLVSRLKNDDLVKPLQPTRNTVIEAVTTQPTETENAPQRGRRPEPNTVHHPTIPGLVLRQGEASLLKPKPGTSNRRRKHRKASNSPAAIAQEEQVLKVDVDRSSANAASVQLLSPSPSALNEVKSKSKTVAKRTGKHKKQLPKHRQTHEVVQQDMKDEEAKSFTVDDCSCVQENLEFKSAELPAGQLESVATLGTEVSLEASDSTKPVTKKKKKSRAKPSTEDEIEKALKEIEAEENREKCKRDAKIPCPLQTVPVETMLAGAAARRTVRAKRQVPKLESSLKVEIKTSESVTGESPNNCIPSSESAVQSCSEISPRLDCARDPGLDQDHPGLTDPVYHSSAIGEGTNEVEMIVPLPENVVSKSMSSVTVSEFEKVVTSERNAEQQTASSSQASQVEPNLGPDSCETILPPIQCEKASTELQVAVSPDLTLSKEANRATSSESGDKIENELKFNEEGGDALKETPHILPQQITPIEANSSAEFPAESPADNSVENKTSEALFPIEPSFENTLPVAKRNLGSGHKDIKKEMFRSEGAVMDVDDLLGSVPLNVPCEPPGDQPSLLSSTHHLIVSSSIEQSNAPLESFVLSLSRKERKLEEKKKKRDKSRNSSSRSSKSPVPGSSPSSVDDAADATRKRVSQNQKDRRKLKTIAQLPGTATDSEPAKNIEVISQSEIELLPKEETCSYSSENIAASVETSVKSEPGSFHLKLDALSDAWMDMLDGEFTMSDENTEIEADADEAIQNKQAPALTDDYVKNAMIPPTAENIGATLPLETTDDLVRAQGRAEFQLQGDGFSEEWMNILDDASLLISDDEEDEHDVRQQQKTVDADEPMFRFPSSQMRSILTTEIGLVSKTSVTSVTGDILAEPDSGSTIGTSFLSITEEVPHILVPPSSLIQTTRETELESNQFGFSPPPPAEQSSIRSDCERPTAQYNEQVSASFSMEPMLNEYAEAERQWYMHLAKPKLTQTTNASEGTACLDQGMNPSTRTRNNINVGSEIKPEPLCSELFQNEELKSFSTSAEANAAYNSPHIPIPTPDLPSRPAEAKAHRTAIIIKAKGVPQFSKLLSSDKTRSDPEDALLKLNLSHCESIRSQSSRALIEAASKVVQEVQKLDAEIPSCIVKDAIKCFETIAAKQNLDTPTLTCKAELRYESNYADARQQLVEIINEFVNSCQDQILEYNNAERIWHEHEASKRQNESQVGSRHDDDDEDRKPPPDSDPFNRKGHSGSDGKGGSSGGAGNKPQTHVLYSGLSQLSSQWLDSSTKIPVLNHVFDNDGSVEQSRAFAGVGIRNDYRRLIRVNSKYALVSDSVGLIGEPQITFQDHYLRTIKVSAQADLQNFEELLESSALQLSNLNIEAVETTVSKTDELLSTFKDLELSFSTLKEIISGLPQQDAEVKDLAHQSSDLAYQTRAVLAYTGKLNKCAKDQLTQKLLEELKVVEDKLPTKSSLEASSVPAIETDEVDLSVVPCATQQQTLALVMAEIPKSDEPKNSSDIFHSNPRDGSDEDVITSREVASIQLPKTEVHSLMHDGAGGTFVAKVERSGFISKTREISMVQSFQGGVPAEADSNIRISSSHYEDQSQSHYSESGQQEPSHTSVKFFRTVKGDSSPGRITEMRSSSPIPPGAMSPGLSQDFLEQTDPHVDGESLTVRVRQVTQHVTRRIIRKRRRIIRKVTVVNGVETVTEEVIEEPDEVDEHTSEFSSGPVTDFTGRLGNVGPRYSRRPVSPGVVISELQDQLTAAEAGATESNVATNITSPSFPIPDSRESEHLQADPSSGTLASGSETKVSDLHEPFRPDELPISVSECSMRISVKPLQEVLTEPGPSAVTLGEEVSSVEIIPALNLNETPEDQEEHSHRISEEIRLNTSDPSAAVSLLTEDKATTVADKSSAEPVKPRKKSKKIWDRGSREGGQSKADEKRMPEDATSSRSKEVSDSSNGQESEIEDGLKVAGSRVGSIPSKVSDLPHEIQPVMAEASTSGSNVSVDSISKDAGPFTKSTSKHLDVARIQNETPESIPLSIPGEVPPKALISDRRSSIQESAKAKLETNTSQSLKETDSLLIPDETKSDTVAAFSSIEFRDGSEPESLHGLSPSGISGDGAEPRIISVSAGSTDAAHPDRKVLSISPANPSTSTTIPTEQLEPERRKKRRSKNKRSSLEKDAEGIAIATEACHPEDSMQLSQPSVAVEAFEAWAQTGPKLENTKMQESEFSPTNTSDAGVMTIIATDDPEFEHTFSYGKITEEFKDLAVKSAEVDKPEDALKIGGSSQTLQQPDSTRISVSTDDSETNQVAEDNESQGVCSVMFPHAGSGPAKGIDGEESNVRDASGPKAPPRRRQSASPSQKSTDLGSTEIQSDKRSLSRRRQSKSPSSKTVDRESKEAQPDTGSPPGQTKSKAPSLKSPDGSTEMKSDKRSPSRRVQSKSPSPTPTYHKSTQEPADKKSSPSRGQTKSPSPKITDLGSTEIQPDKESPPRQIQPMVPSSKSADLGSTKETPANGSPPTQRQSKSPSPTTADLGSTEEQADKESSQSRRQANSPSPKIADRGSNKEQVDTGSTPSQIQSKASFSKKADLGSTEVQSDRGSPPTQRQSKSPSPMSSDLGSTAKRTDTESSASRRKAESPSPKIVDRGSNEKEPDTGSTLSQIEPTAPSLKNAVLGSTEVQPDRESLTRQRQSKSPSPKPADPWSAEEQEIHSTTPSPKSADASNEMKPDIESPPRRRQSTSPTEGDLIEVQLDKILPPRRGQSKPQSPMQADLGSTEEQADKESSESRMQATSPSPKIADRGSNEAQPDTGSTPSQIQPRAPSLKSIDVSIEMKPDMESPPRRRQSGSSPKEEDILPIEVQPDKRLPTRRRQSKSPSPIQADFGSTVQPMMGPPPRPRRSKSPSPMHADLGVAQELLGKTSPLGRRQSKSPSPKQVDPQSYEAQPDMSPPPKAPPRRRQSKSPSPQMLDVSQSAHDATGLDQSPRAPPRRRQSKSPSPMAEKKPEEESVEPTLVQEVQPLKSERRKKNRKIKKAGQKTENISTESVDSEDVGIAEESIPEVTLIEHHKIQAELKDISSSEEQKPVCTTSSNIPSSDFASNTLSGMSAGDAQSATAFLEHVQEPISDTSLLEDNKNTTGNSPLYTPETTKGCEILINDPGHRGSKDAVTYEPVSSEQVKPPQAQPAIHEIPSIAPISAEKHEQEKETWSVSGPSLGLSSEAKLVGSDFESKLSCSSETPSNLEPPSDATWDQERNTQHSPLLKQAYPDNASEEKNLLQGYDESLATFKQSSETKETELDSVNQTQTQPPIEGEYSPSPALSLITSPEYITGDETLNQGNTTVDIKRAAQESREGISQPRRLTIPPSNLDDSRPSSKSSEQAGFSEDQALSSPLEGDHKPQLTIMEEKVRTDALSTDAKTISDPSQVDPPVTPGIWPAMRENMSDIDSAPLGLREQTLGQFNINPEHVNQIQLKELCVKQVENSKQYGDSTETPLVPTEVASAKSDEAEDKTRSDVIEISSQTYQTTQLESLDKDKPVRAPSTFPTTPSEFDSSNKLPPKDGMHDRAHDNLEGIGHMHKYVQPVTSASDLESLQTTSENVVAEDQLQKPRVQSESSPSATEEPHPSTKRNVEVLTMDDHPSLEIDVSSTEADIIRADAAAGTKIKNEKSNISSSQSETLNPADRSQSEFAGVDQKSEPRRNSELGVPHDDIAETPKSSVPEVISELSWNPEEMAPQRPTSSPETIPTAGSQSGPMEVSTIILPAESLFESSASSVFLSQPTSKKDSDKTSEVIIQEEVLDQHPYSNLKVKPPLGHGISDMPTTELPNREVESEFSAKEPDNRHVTSPSQRISEPIRTTELEQNVQSVTLDAAGVDMEVEVSVPTSPGSDMAKYQPTGGVEASDASLSNLDTESENQTIEQQIGMGLAGTSESPIPISKTQAVVSQTHVLDETGVSQGLTELKQVALNLDPTSTSEAKQEQLQEPPTSSLSKLLKLSPTKIRHSPTQILPDSEGTLGPQFDSEESCRNAGGPLDLSGTLQSIETQSMPHQLPELGDSPAASESEVETQHVALEQPQKQSASKKKSIQKVPSQDNQILVQDSQSIEDVPAAAHATRMSQVDIVDVTNDPRYQSPKVEDCKRKLGTLSRARRERVGGGTRRVAIPVSGSTVSESLQALVTDLSDLSHSCSREDETVVVEEFTTILETITVTLQSIQYEITKLNRSSWPGRNAKRKEVESQILQLKSTLEELEHLAQSTGLDGDVKAVLSDICKGSSLEVEELLSKVAENRGDEELQKMTCDQVLSELSESNTNLNSLAEQVELNSERDSMSAEAQLKQLDSLEEQYQLLKLNAELSASTAYQLLTEVPSEALLSSLEELNFRIAAVDTLLTNERNRILQVVNLSEEYKQTLEEFSQVIKVAESVLSGRPTVKNLQQLRDQIQRHRRFFGNLGRCQQALEKLELDLEIPTKEAQHELHHRLYMEATDILQRAARKQQMLNVAASRLARLQDALKEEILWLDALANKIPSLESATSTSCDPFCSIFQGLYTDVIVHQARIQQLKAVSDGLAEAIECPDLESQVDAVMENLLINDNRITALLQSLVGFRDIYSNYERLITRLRTWLQRAESKIDQISLQPQAHPYDFWELKAQLESQQPLRDEAAALLNQALGLLSVGDENQIRENFENFDSRWNNLLKAVGETELENYVDEDPSASIENNLNSVDKEVQEIGTTLQTTSVVVQSEEDLYSYLETLQILKAQILNQKYRLNTISQNSVVDPANADKIGTLFRTISQLDLEITEELEAAHVIRDKLSTFALISLKTRRFQDTIRARVGQWSSFFELSQDILKQAFENCQSMDDDLTQNRVSLGKMSQLLQSFPSTSHLSLSTTKLDGELQEMEAASHALTLQAEDLRHKVKEQMKFWQDFSTVSNSVAQLVSQHQTTLELLRNEVPGTLPALNISRSYLQSLEDAVRDSKSVEDLQNISDDRRPEYPQDLKVLINSTCQGLLNDWKEVESQVKSLKTSYSDGQDLWSKILPLQREVEEWLNSVGAQVELGTPSRVRDRLKNLPIYEDKMNELQALTTELCVTLCPTHKDNSAQSLFRFPISSELESLSKKLQFLRSYLSSMQPEPTPDVLEEAKQALSSISQDLRSDIGAEATADRLNTVHQQLLNLGNAEGRMRAVQLSSSTVPDTEFLELLESSQSLFQQTFLEYLKIWSIISEKEDLNELYHLWKNYLNQVESYLEESVPATREQLLEDTSLCTVHQSILTGQYQSLASAMEKKPSDFETLHTLHTKIESQLSERQQQIQERLSSWRTFRNCQEGLSLWLRHMEREKRGLELNFLQLRRLEPTKAKIQGLVARCPRGQELLEEFKRNKMSLMPFCPSALKSSLAQDLASHVSRYNNLQAALKTWLDHVNRLTSVNQDFQTKGNELALQLATIWEQLQELKTPSTFTELKTHIHTLKELHCKCSALSPLLEEMQSTLEEMKAAISPADSRILSQKIWSLSQQHIDLMTTLAQSLANAEESLDLIPAFDSRCKRWMVWVDCMREKLERPHSRGLVEFHQWISRDARQEITSKISTYQWLSSTVKQLSEMTSGKERKEFLKVSKEIKSKWEGLNESVERRTAKVSHLLQMLQQLSMRFQDSSKKLKNLENYVASPLSIQEFRIDQIDDALRVHEIEQRRLNNESSEINHVLNLAEVASSDCDDFRMYTDAASTRASLEALHNAWNRLIARFQHKYQLLIQLKDSCRNISDNSEYLESLLGQLEADIGALEKEQEDSSQPRNNESEVAKSESLLECLRCLTPKVEDLANDYSFVAKQVNSLSTGELGERVKHVVSSWCSLNKRCQKVVENRRQELHFNNFCSVLEPVQSFVRNINEKAQALEKDNSYTPAEKIRILKELKAECQSQRAFEDAMQETGRLSSEADANLKAPIKERIDGYFAMKQKLEKLCGKIMQTSQKQLALQEESKKAKDEEVSVQSRAVQVSTLESERITEPAVDRRGTPAGEEDNRSPMSDTSSSEMQADAPSLTRVDIYKNELDKAVDDSEANMKILDSLLSKAGKGKQTQDQLVKSLAAAQKSVDMVVHLHDLLTKEHGASNEFSRSRKVKALSKKLKEREEKVRIHGQSTRESSPAKKVTCPVCSPKQRGVWDSTLWRLEQWLQHAEGTLKETMRSRPPTNLEHLEDTILSHRELLLDLDSHRSLVHDLTNVLSHLSEHGATETIGEMELERLKDRLSETLQWWNRVCHNAALWQSRLQIALLENSDFHQTIEEYDTFISSIKESVKELEPVDVSVPRNLIVPKLLGFKHLSEKLVRIEPELRTLLQTAEQLFVNAKAIEKEGTRAADEPYPTENAASIFTTPQCSLVLERIASLNHELGTCLRVTEAYVRYLTDVVQREAPLGESPSPAMLLNLSDQIHDLGSASPTRSSTPLPSTSIDNDDVPDEATRSLIATGGRYAYRAFRASLPIQALILLLLGAATLLPYSEQDFSCFSANNFARSLEPMLHWNGPPRI